jgi:hypothetical protein
VAQLNIGVERNITPKSADVATSNGHPDIRQIVMALCEFEDQIRSGPQSIQRNSRGLKKKKTLHVLFKTFQI